MMKNRSRHLAAGGAMLLAFGSLIAAPAVADDLVTTCHGTAGAVTVPGDLVVPRGKSCDLTGTTVTGDLTVRAGADLLGSEVSIGGNLVGAADSYLEISDAEVSGDVKLTDVHGAVVENSRIDGRLVNGPGQGMVTGFLYASGLDVGGAFTVRSGEVYVEASTVAGALNSQRSGFTDVRDVFVDGRLVISDAREGSMLCAVVAARTADITGNQGPVQVGSDGPTAACADGSTYIGGNLTVQDNTGGVLIDDVIVSEDLVLERNTPEAELGSTVRVRGEITGSSARMRVATSDRSAPKASARQAPGRGESLRDAGLSVGRAPRLRLPRPGAQTSAERASG